MDRKSFLGSASAFIAGIVTGAPAAALAETPTRSLQDGKDWMKGLNGKHRQFFHALTASDTPMLMASNYLDAYVNELGEKASDVNAVIGVHGPALSVAFNDAAWAKYSLGKVSSVNDPATKEAATKNTFATGGSLSIETLQKRGVVFLVCNTALRLRSRAVAAERKETPDAVYADFKASLLPGMILVPALVVAMNQAQEAGFSYVRAS